MISFPGRSGPQKQARMLARHGYGVLLFDRRGEGDSEGEPNSWGWGGGKDVDAAIEYLQRRPDVDPDRIGGIGRSVGGELMIETAAGNDQLKAVVSEGAGARTYSEDMDEDLPGIEKVLGAPVSAFKTASIAVSSNRLPPENLKDLAAQDRPAAPVDRRAGEGRRRGAQPRLPRRGGRQQHAVGDPRVDARRRARGTAGGVRAARGRLLRRGAGR